MNQNLEKTIRVLKHRNILNTTSNAELARLSGLSTKTITRNKSEITLYSQTAPQPSQYDNDYIDKQLAEYYIEIAKLNTNKSQYLYSNILGAVAGYVLRQETDLINNVQKEEKVINTGLCFIHIATQIQARKDKDAKGTPIHSKNKYSQYLLNEYNKTTFIDILFARTSNYSSGAYSKSWKLTQRSVDILDRVVDIVFEWLGNVPVVPLHIGGGICASTNKTSLASPIYATLPLTSIRKLSVPSILQILNHSHPSTTLGNIDVSLANLSSTDSSCGRHYNVFTRLRSKERLALGYTNYDISGGLQAICLNLIAKFYPAYADTLDNYRILINYAHDKSYKSAFRQKIANDLNMSVDDVKALLTAYANGGSKNINKHKQLKEFYEESDLLRRQVTVAIALEEPKVLEKAIKQSGNTFPIGFDWTKEEKENDIKLARQKASVFFFIWTYYEMQIRNAMLKVVDDGISVHDAIYSKHKLPCSKFEAAAKEQGFTVSISH